MARKRMKAHAKDLRRLPFLKKRVAEFVAKAQVAIYGLQGRNLANIYLNGHRGLLSMGEKEICAEFDKIYELFSSGSCPALEGLHLFRIEYKNIMGKKEKRYEVSAASFLEEANELFHDLFEEIVFHDAIKAGPGKKRDGK